MTTIHSSNPESRLFNPPAELIKSAAISGMDAYRALCQEAERITKASGAAWRAKTPHGTDPSPMSSTSPKRLSINGSPTAN